MPNAHTLIGIALLFIVATSLVFLWRQPAVSEVLREPVRAVFSEFSAGERNDIDSSQYKGRVVFDFVSLGTGTGGNDAYVRIRALGGDAEYINVTGWTVSSSGGSVKIPVARDLNTSDGVSGNIFLRNGSTLTLYAGKSPRGENMRVSELEWSAWLNWEFLSYPHGTLVLKDGSGVTVDVYEY